MRIETERLLIRLMEPIDFEDSYEHRSDPEVCRFISAPLTREQTQHRIEKAIIPWSGEEHSKLALAIELKEEGKLIGELMFKYTNVESDVGEIGYRLNRKYQGAGYAYEAVFALVRSLFDDMNLHKISAVCLIENTGSWKLMEKLGMHREGVLKSHFRLDDRWFDGYSYAVVNEAHRV